MIEPCTILDLGELTDIVNRFVEGDALMRIRLDIMGVTNGTWFLYKDCCMCYEKVAPKVAQAHIYSVSRESRGRELRDFAIETGCWMIDNRGIKSIVNYVDKERRSLQLFMKMIGSRKVCELSDQILYVSTKEECV